MDFKGYSTEELSDMQRKIVKRNPQESKKSLYEAFGAESITPETERAVGKVAGIPAPYLTALAETAKEGIATPALHALNMGLMGYPRRIAEQAGYEYPEPTTGPGQILAKGAGVAGAVGSPILRGITGLGGLPTSAGRGAVAGALKGAAIGGAWAPLEGAGLLAPEERLKGAGIGAVAGAATGGLVGGVRGALSRRAEKVRSIREKMKDWSRKESKDYGKMLKEVGKEGQDIDPTDALTWMERELFERGLIDETGKKLRQVGVGKAEKGLLSSYERLSKVYADASGGKIPIETVIGEARKIKAGGGKARVKFKPTEEGLEASKLHGSFMDKVKRQIRSDVFDKGQAKYAKYKQEFNAVDKKFDIWSTNIETGKGETSLNKIFRSGEMRAIADVIERETGVSLTPDKITSILSMPAVRNTAIGGGVIWGLIHGLKKLGKGEPMASGPGIPKSD